MVFFKIISSKFLFTSLWLISLFMLINTCDDIISPLSAYDAQAHSWAMPANAVIDADMTVSKATFSPDESQLCLVLETDDKQILTVVKTGKNSMKRTEWETPLPVHSIIFSPDSHHLFTGHKDGSVRRWNTNTGKPDKKWTIHDKPITALVVTHTGERLIAGTGEGTIVIWSLTLNKQLDKLPEHQQIYDTGVFALTISPDEKSRVSGGGDNNIRLWNLHTGQQEHLFVGHTQPVRTLAFSSDGSRLASGGDDHVIQLFDVKKGTSFHSYIVHSAPLQLVKFYDNDSKLLSYDTNKLLGTFDIETLTVLRLYKERELQTVSPATSQIVLLDEHPKPTAQTLRISTLPYGLICYPTDTEQKQARQRVAELTGFADPIKTGILGFFTELWDTNNTKLLDQFFLAGIARQKTSTGTILHLAAEYGWPDLARAGHHCGTDVETRNSLGMTALHMAASTGQASVLEVLLEMGANLNAQLEDGRTALDLAQEADRHKIKTLLEKANASHNSKIENR